MAVGPDGLRVPLVSLTSGMGVVGKGTELLVLGGYDFALV